MMTDTDLEVMSEKIKDIVSGAPSIKVAYDHEPKSITSFPAATLFWDGFSQSDEASHRKSVSWNWIIRIYIPLNTSDIRIPQTQIKRAVVEVLNHLRKNPSLNGSCLYHSVSNGDVNALTDLNKPLLVADLTLGAITNEDF
jgi:hypothetical protein